MNHIKDNHEQEEDRKAKWRQENKDSLRYIELFENDIAENEHRVDRILMNIDIMKSKVKELKKQIGWQE